MRRVDEFISSRQALGRKGLIHSISYRYADIIKRASKHRDEIITYKPHEAQRIISQFMEDSKTHPTPILCGPNFAEGYDFKDERARYQFIWKVPTVDSRNPLIAARKKRDKKYPYYLAGKTIQQMVGRVVRSSSDYGETVILDTHWGKWMQTAVPWPRSFRKSWVTVRDLPAPIKF
jgi:Rad3-related DNA helicase